MTLLRSSALPRVLRIGTRGSDLARWQAERVKALLAGSGVDGVLEIIATSGDEQARRRAQGGAGKGLFTKEIEDALLAGRIDIAVHSLKDLLIDLPEGLVLAAVAERADPRDALVSRDGVTLEALSAGAAVGSSSVRRQAAVRAARPDVRVVALRGNVPTRYSKVRDGAVDAAVMALAGLERLGLTAGAVPLDPEVFVPAPGQGAIAVESRAGDTPVLGVLRALDDATARTAVTAERATLGRLETGCNVPIGAHCVRRDGDLTLHAAVYAVDGSRTIRARIAVDPDDPERCGVTAAERLLAQGAADLIAAAARTAP